MQCTTADSYWYYRVHTSFVTDITGYTYRPSLILQAKPTGPYWQNRLNLYVLNDITVKSCRSLILQGTPYILFILQGKLLGTYWYYIFVTLLGPYWYIIYFITWQWIPSHSWFQLNWSLYNAVFSLFNSAHIFQVLVVDGELLFWNPKRNLILC